MSAQSLPLFHLYGDPPDEQAFDFIHVETIASRSQVHDWLIRAHRHRNLFQILLIEHGGGEMIFEASSLDFTAPAAIIVQPNAAHGFRFRPGATNGWVVSFTEDVAQLHRRTISRGAGAAARARGRAGGDAGIRATRSAGCRRCATIFIRSVFSRAKAIAWRCARCWR